MDENLSGLEGSESAVGRSNPDVLRLLRAAGEDAGMDPVTDLYNEALKLAQVGKYGEAQSHLNVLLGIAPDDADGHLLLAKVLSAGQQWRRALSALDAAAQCGAKVPNNLRDAVLRNLQSEDSGRAVDPEARAQRENQELVRHRDEARRLRSENASLLTRTHQLERSSLRWASWTVFSSAVACGMLVLRLVGGGAGSPAAAPLTLADEAAAVPAASGEVPVLTADQAVGGAEPVRNADAAEKARQALTGNTKLEGATLEVIVRAGKAQLSGSVRSHAQLKDAMAALAEVEGIESVGADNVINLAKRDGAEHVVASGDNLAKISWRYYGTDALYTQIQAANPELGGKTDLKIGQTLKIPAVKAAN